MADAQVGDKEEKTNISEYLDTPRKRQKNFVVLAVYGCMDLDLVKYIESFVKRTYPGLALVRPKNEEELARYLTRKLSIIIIHDQFIPQERCFNLIQEVKTRRRKDVIPVLFFTENQEELIRGYRDHLSAFQEADDFCDYTALNKTQILEYIKQGIDNKNRRRSRRYKVSIASTLYSLRHDSKVNAHFIDLSIHGGLIRLNGGLDMKCDDQIKVSLPKNPRLISQGGEFIRLSGRVRRVHIGGDVLAFSFENISEQKNTELTKYILDLIKDQV